MFNDDYTITSINGILSEVTNDVSDQRKEKKKVKTAFNQHSADFQVWTLFGLQKKNRSFKLEQRETWLHVT